MLIYVNICICNIYLACSVPSFCQTRISEYAAHISQSIASYVLQNQLPLSFPSLRHQISTLFQYKKIEGCYRGILLKS